MKSKFLFLFLVSTQVLFAQTFTEVPQSPPFEGVFFSSIAFADVDADNDQDILITGATGAIGTNIPITKLYTNDLASSSEDCGKRKGVAKFIVQ